MFRPDIALAIESGGDKPITTTYCIERTFRAEHRLNQLKKMQTKMFKSRKSSGIKEATSLTETKASRITSHKDRVAIK